MALGANFNFHFINRRTNIKLSSASAGYYCFRIILRVDIFFHSYMIISSEVRNKVLAEGEVLILSEVRNKVLAEGEVLILIITK